MNYFNSVSVIVVWVWFCGAIVTLGVINFRETKKDRVYDHGWYTIPIFFEAAGWPIVLLYHVSRLFVTGIVKLRDIFDHERFEDICRVFNPPLTRSQMLKRACLKKGIEVTEYKTSSENIPLNKWGGLPVYNDDINEVLSRR